MIGRYDRFMRLKPGDGGGMIHKFKVGTSAKSEMADITRRVQEVVRKSDLAEGICHIFVPHTTCALAINENADPDVKRDIIAKLDDTVSGDFGYRHSEGNSPAHIKSVLVGPVLTVFVEDGALQLGTWQGIYLCEYDGPREREIWVKTLKG
jgi:secondary thiamine-phosphate synthase enzyme